MARLGCLLAAFLLLTTAVQAAAPSRWTVVSPDGKLAVTLGLVTPEGLPGYPADKVRPRRGVAVVAVGDCPGRSGVHR
jgi:hypothetical protein